MRFSVAAPLVVAVTAAAAAVDAFDDLGVGREVDDRQLVQGDNQRPCEVGDCQWGVYGSVDVKRFWVTHPNVFWRCHKPGLMAMTFDDGPSDRTGDVLDELKKHNVTATFFINGVNIVNNPQNAPMLTRAEEEGHVVAHHTYDHEKSANRVEYKSDGTPTEATLEWFEKQIEGNIARAQDWLPQYGLRPFFRPPWLDMDEATSTYLQEKYQIYVVQITADTDDWKDGKTVHTIAQGITTNVYAEPGDVDENSWITLQHDKIENTVGAIPKIVEFGLSLGYEFVGIDECLDFPVENRMRITNAPTITPCEGEPCEATYQCRSQYGNCGLGPDYCDENPQWVPRCITGGERVPYNCSAPACENLEHCRSASGFCNEGTEYCNENSVWLPSCSDGANGPGRVPVNCSAPACENLEHCRSAAGFCNEGSEYCNANSIWMPGCAGRAAVASLAIGVFAILSGVALMLVAE